MAHYGLIEAGGTKFVLGIADESGAISARHRIATTTPDETLNAAIAWFRAQELDLAAFGIASFGPLDLDRTSPCWGQITRTTKPHWSHTDIAGPFARAFGCAVHIETDVNGAALGEARWGAGKGHSSTLYITVGTGIGGGFVARDSLLRGLSHPEMGHIRLPRHADDSGFAGACPFHGDCLEGLASGPAIIQRWGASLSKLGDDHPAHAIIAWYLGQAICTFQAIMEPARIVLGGGVMATPGLLDRVRQAAAKAGGGYFTGDPLDIVVAPGLGENTGLLGALAVAISSTS
jgi:fructokinase